jgi:TonB family protein
MILALLAAAPATAAAPPSQGVVSLDDYPPAALRRGEQGLVHFQVVINPEGRVDTCTVLLSSGSKDLDDATCLLVTSRARFSPARDDNDRPIHATYRSSINWRIAGLRAPSQRTIPPDLDLTINQAPQGAKLPLQFMVRYFVKADGTASHCEFSNDWVPKSAVVPPQVLVALACDAVMRSPIQPVRNHKNEPVDASDGATVRFSVKP